MGVHEEKSISFQAMRQKHPEALILRCLGPMHYVAFDGPGDAIGHRSADRKPTP